jgi:hypothetical protein
MSFIIAGCVLLVALLSDIVLDHIGNRKWQETRRDVPSLYPW